MINLIPTSAKRKLLLEYWSRVISVWFLLWATALIASACILLPAYVLIGGKITAYEASSVAASEKVSGYENISSELATANTQAKKIIDEAKLVKFSNLLTLFSELQGSEVHINKIQLGRAKAGVAPVIMGGMADSRQSLASFRDRLLADSTIESVDLPISNLAQDKNIAFSITVVLRKQENI
ncbi:MAG: hypothetical protein RLZZ230_42 [Candidatus Parcubacteria bacterium]|jgi:hypothetical protein